MKIIVANWKMNGDVELVSSFIETFNNIHTKNTVVICPPAPLICRFSGFKYAVGAQNCYCEDAGAFTGEHSPKLLKSLGCSHVIIGHSERRTLFHETDDIIYKKWEAATLNGLTPIVCIGETAKDRNNWQQILSSQLNRFANKPAMSTIFAYEPIWSIGTGVIPSIDEISSKLTFIKQQIGVSHSVLYGGSVNSKNAVEILKCENIDGLLIGGASLKVEEFAKIAIM